MLLTSVSLGLMVLLTLWPVDFSFRDTLLRLRHPILLVGWGESSAPDVLLNAVLFMPFGFGLAGMLTWRQGMRGLLPADVEVVPRRRASPIPEAVRQEIDRLTALYDSFPCHGQGAACDA